MSTSATLKDCVGPLTTTETMTSMVPVEAFMVLMTWTASLRTGGQQFKLTIVFLTLMCL